MRTFVAIDLPDSVRAALAREQARLQAACGRNSDIRWTRPEGLHLTLKFLGEIAPERVPEVATTLNAVSPFDPFEVDVGGFGFFPSARRARVFWVGLEAPDALGELAAGIEAALEGLGFAREDRPFRPHLTLARFDKPGAQPALEAELKIGDAARLGRFAVSEFSLFQSKLRPGGAEYTKLARFPRGTAEQVQRTTSAALRRDSKL
jgi:RNA 2',3'-cyclic 3'-phosphodiesterase